MYAEDVLALLDVRHGDHDLAVEAPGPEEGRVEDVGPVRRGEDDDAVLRVEAVHLDEHLVQGLLPFVMAPAVAGTPGAADGVQFVDEDDAGGAPPPLLEQVADPARADADEHLDEIGTRHVEEGNVRLSGDGLGEKGLARSRHAHEKDALRDFRPHLGELLGVLQELDDLLELVLRLLLAGDVGEVDLLGAFDVALGLALSEREGLVARALGLAIDEPDKEKPDDPREELDEEPSRRHSLHRAGDLYLLVLELLDEGGIGVRDIRLEDAHVPRLALKGALDLVLVDDLHRIDLALVQVLHESRVRDLRHDVLVVDEEGGHENPEEDKQQGEGQAVVAEIEVYRTVIFVLIVVVVVVVVEHAHGFPISPFKLIVKTRAFPPD